MKNFTILLLTLALIVPLAVTQAQDPPAGTDDDRNACYEGGFLYPCPDDPYFWQAGWYLQNWIDSGYSADAQNDLYEWTFTQFVDANPEIFEDGNPAGPVTQSFCVTLKKGVDFLISITGDVGTWASLITVKGVVDYIPGSCDAEIDSEFTAVVAADKVAATDACIAATGDPKSFVNLTTDTPAGTVWQCIVK